MKMLEPSAQIDWLATELLSMSSVGGFPAKTSALQEKEQGLRESAADCGGSSIGSSKKSGRRGSLLKTYQPFDITDWATSCGPSLRSGTMRNGTVYPLPPLAPLTAGTESGLWPTPRAQDSKHAAATEWELTTAHAGTVGSLRVQVIKRSWPTPNAGLEKHSTNGPYWENRIAKKRQRDIQMAVYQQTGSGALNPTWVEWLMGFPLEWTDLKPSEMPSSRKSRKSSEKE